MSDIFLSYSREDAKVAKRLAEMLETQGWSVFWDRRIPAGKSWRDVIRGAIADARCVVVLWSQHSVCSDWVVEEADAGLRRRVLIPALIQTVEPPLGFGSIHAADLSAWNGNDKDPAICQFFGDVSGILGPPPSLTAEDRPRAESVSQHKAAQQHREQARAEAGRKAASDEQVARPTQQVAQPIQQAKVFLAGESLSPQEVLRLAKRLKGMEGQNGFRWARRILARAHKDQAALAADPELARVLGQEQSLCTYKDPDLPALRRLHDALSILQTVDHPDRSSDDETLGQAGAIYKQLWADTGQKLYLERSYAYYRKAYDFDPVGRNPGYCGINAAFVLDLLADLETRDAALAGTEAEMAARRRAEAAAIRGCLIELLTPLEHEPDKSGLSTDWWYLVTRAEAHFGLDEHAEAGALLLRAKHDSHIEPWQFFSTARQLATLHQLRSSAAGVTGNGAVEILAAFLAPNSGSEPGSAGQADRGMLQTKAALESAFKGQVGLALSGGGFRASIFHLGVLAKLAELDLLRRVEVLSCVSGGSIVGAQYYLQLREELPARRHRETPARRAA
jgi:TIR domain